MERWNETDPSEWEFEIILDEDSDQPEDDVAEDLDSVADPGEEDDDNVYGQGSDGVTEKNALEEEQAEQEMPSEEVEPEVLSQEEDVEVLSQEEDVEVLSQEEDVEVLSQEEDVEVLSQEADLEVPAEEVPAAISEEQIKSQSYPIALVDIGGSLPFVSLSSPTELDVWTESASDPGPVTVEVEVEIHTTPEPGTVTDEPVAITFGDRLEQVYPRDECIRVNIMEMETVRGRGHQGGCKRGGRRCGIVVASGARGESSDISNEIVDTDDDVHELAPFLFENDPEAMNFDWQPINSFHGQREVFLPQNTGPTQYLDNAYEAFRAIWTDDILDKIVTETNDYAEQHPNLRTPIKPTNVHEILMLFAFYMLFGIKRYPTINACFSEEFLFWNKSFSAFFTRTRYCELISMLHFSDNLTADRTSSLFKINPVIEHLNQRFQALYIPKRNITINESSTLWMGPIDCQYMPGKTTGIEIKSFELCCSTSSYLWSFFVCTGCQEAEGGRASIGCPKVIPLFLSLIRPLLHKGYTLWMHNWFNSPILARFLKRNQTDCVGTLSKNRKHVPKHVVKSPLKKGQYMARTSRDTCIVSWQDNSRVTTISTFHNDEIEMGPSKGRNDVYKPKVVWDYNKFMGGVDKKNQMLEPYDDERQRYQYWYLKWFKHLLNVSVLNSRILVAESTGHQVEHLKFRTSLIHEIYSRHYNQYPAKRQQPPNANYEHPYGRYDLSLGHFPVLLSSSDVGDSGVTDLMRPNKRTRWNGDQPQAAKLQCKLCVFCQEPSNRKNQNAVKKTNYKCKVCNVPLCCAPCFQLYHTSSAGHNPAPN